jgi:hypothetical protein
MVSSRDDVGFQYDELYDVAYLYEHDGRRKRFSATYGRKNGAWIAPPGVEMASRHESAMIVATAE